VIQVYTRSGEIGESEHDALAKWKSSIDVATSWEAAPSHAVTPSTRPTDEDLDQASPPII